MESRRRVYVAGVATVVLFLLIQLGALSLVEPFDTAGYQAVEDPSDPRNSLVYLVAILVATGVILLVLKFGLGQLLRAFVALMGGMLSLYAFSVLIPRVIVVSGFNVLAWGLAGLLVVALYVYPEWYVIDAAGVVMGAGGAGLFGISFGPLPAILLLAVLAVYDAISVYQTRHMLTLAEGVTDLKLPLVLVIPLTRSYSFLTANPVDQEAAASGDRDTERDAFFVGLGDAVLPTVLVASAAVFVEAPVFDVPIVTLNLPALTAMIGTLCGLGVLLWMVAKGRAHAGLPLLNGGTIAGYLVGVFLSGIPLTEALGLATYV